VSPASNRAQSRQRRNLIVSVVAVVVISLGSFAAVFSVKWSPRLGLDLAGGLSVVYKTSHSVPKSELQETVDILNNRVNGLGVSGAQVSTSGNDQIAVAVPGVKNAAQVLHQIGQTARLYFRPVLCYAPPYVSLKQLQKEQKSTTTTTAKGSKAKAKTTGESTSSTTTTPGSTTTPTTTTTPGSITSTTAKPAAYVTPSAPATSGALAGAQLTAFHATGTTTTVPATTTPTTAAPSSSTTTTTTPAKSSTSSPGALPTSCPSQYQLVVGANLTGTTSSANGVQYDVGPYPELEIYPTSSAVGTDNPKATVLQAGLPGSTFPYRYLEGPAELDGTAVKTASAQLNQTGQWVVNITLTTAGSKGWDNLTQKYFHEIIGIELDGVVQSAPITQPSQTTWSSFDGQVQISGSFTQSSADALAIALQFGSLPVTLKQLTTQTVSPTLGKSALKAGLGAGVVGLLLVLLYVLFYYRALGLVVISGLALTAALLWAIISSLGHTTFSPSFDLAGITGLIVSIGITVDSYIVYFERLKDETRAGRSIRTSVDRGFKSAWRTVWAADFVSLLAAIVLYEVAVGDVKGFAFFLGLSTIMDMGVTWFYTRPLVILLGRSERAASTGRFGIARGLNPGRRPGDVAPVGAGK
jgi:preprotein translocase subunit SecD